MLKRGIFVISPFEATLLGILAEGPASRYEVMKLIQTQSLYWAGSAGAVYSAIDRLFRKGMLQIKESTEPRLFEITALGLEKGYEFLKSVVPAEKLVLDPCLVRLRVRGLDGFSSSDRVEYYRAQLGEYVKAKKLVNAKEKGFTGKDIVKRLSDVAIAQLNLEEVLLKELLNEELEIQ